MITLENFLGKLGNKLNEERRKQKYTLEDLEFYSEIDMSDLNRIEKGKANITMKTLLRISAALNIHPKELFDFELPEMEK